MLAGTMAMLAWRTGAPELAITEQEEAVFLGRVQNVMRHYSVKSTQKTMDWAALIGCTVSMSGTRAFAIHQRLKAERGGQVDERGQVIQWPKRSRTRPEEVPPGGHQAAPVEAPAFVPSAPFGEPDGEGF